MPLTDFFLHLLNFVAPAIWVGVWLALAARLCWRRAWPAGLLMRSCLVNSGVGLGVLTAGLLVFDTDGKMVSYFSLVAGGALSQTWLARGLWRVRR